MANGNGNGNGRRKSRKRLIFIGGGVVLLAVFGLMAARRGGKEIDPSRLAAIEKGDLARSVVATGKVQPLTKVEIKSKASGLVKRLFVDYGDQVKEGQVLAELDREQLEAAVREARANLLAAEASWERNKIEAEGPDLPFLKSALERARKLYADGLIAPSLLEDADKGWQMGLNKQTAAKSQAAVSKAEVEKARAALERYQTDLRYATITSPMDGLVLSRDVEVGDAVSSILVQYGSATAELVSYSLLVALGLGVPLGMVAAYRRDHWQDAVLRVAAILGYATPVFFIGLMLKLIFSIYLGVLPVAGRISTAGELTMGTITNPSPFYLVDALRLGDPGLLADVLSHAILPGITLGLLVGGVFLRLVRTNLIGTLERPYIESARSRGVAETRLVRTHALRPALIPVITVMGMQIAMSLGGAVLTETTFEWKGLGFLLVQYMSARDYVAVQGIVMMLAVIVAVTNFIVDVVAALVDPRVRY